jgi:hypothetical protein
MKIWLSLHFYCDKDMQILLQDGRTGILLWLRHMQILLCFRVGMDRKTYYDLEWGSEIYYASGCIVKFTMIWNAT